MKIFLKFALGLILIIGGIGLLSVYMLKPPYVPVPPSERHIFTQLNIYNPGKPILFNQTIIIDKGVIEDIRPSLPSDKGTICEGCYVMPGLIDAHVHTPPSVAIGNRELFSLLYLKHGVTTIRDLGQLDDDLPKLVDHLNSGKLAGPRIYYCGPILDGDPASVPGSKIVLNAEDGRQAVAAHARLGVDCIKVYGNPSPDAYKGVAEEAARIGLPLVGHTPHALSFHDIHNFESQHHTGIPYLDKPAPQTHAYKSQDVIDMTPADIDAVLDVMVKNNISYLPTNANLMSRLTVSDRERFPPSDGFQHLPEFWELAWPSIVSHPETDHEIETELKSFPAKLSFIRQAHARGVDVLVGTDVVMPYVIPGESLHQELKLMSVALGSDDLALQAATQINGKHIDPGKIGDISKGAYADLLLFKTDPRGDITKVQHWDYVIVGGRIYSREDVDAAIDRFDQHFRGRFYSTIMSAAYGFLASDYENSELAKN